MEDKNYTVPLSALKAERAKGKQKLKLMEEKMEELLNNTNIDENIKETAEQLTPDYLAEFADLVKNPTYSDSAERLDEIREYAENNGVSLKTAYNALFAEEKYEKIRQKAEVEAMQKLQAKQARKVEAVDGGSGGGHRARGIPRGTSRCRGGLVRPRPMLR